MPQARHRGGSVRAVCPPFARAPGGRDSGAGARGRARTTGGPAWPERARVAGGVGGLVGRASVSRVSPSRVSPWRATWRRWASGRWRITSGPLSPGGRASSARRRARAPRHPFECLVAAGGGCPVARWGQDVRRRAQRVRWSSATGVPASGGTGGVPPAGRPATGLRPGTDARYPPDDARCPPDDARCPPGARGTRRGEAAAVRGPDARAAVRGARRPCAGPSVEVRRR